MSHQHCGQGGHERSGSKQQVGAECIVQDEGCPAEQPLWCVQFVY